MNITIQRFIAHKTKRFLASATFQRVSLASSVIAHHISSLSPFQYSYNTTHKKKFSIQFFSLI
jgi:hypothetical protein